MPVYFVIREYLKYSSNQSIILMKNLGFRMGWPILTSFMKSRMTKPPPQIKMSPTQLSRQSKLSLFIFLFFGGFGQEGQKKDAFYQSKANTAPMLLRSTYRGIERKDPRPEQAGSVDKMAAL
ncbi:hypothetical protein Tco_0808557 [Tanacetum coccineum]